MDIIDKINTEMEGLSIKEKLNYWFNHIYPEQLDENGRELDSSAQKYFGTRDLICSELGYIPTPIFYQHFSKHLDNNEFLHYIADRSAKEYFTWKEPVFMDNIKINGEGYLNKMIKDCEQQINIIKKRIESGENRKVLKDKIYYEKYLMPFLKHQIAKIRPQKYTKLYEIVGEEKTKIILHAFENLGITKEGVAVLSQRKKSTLRGVIEAFREKGILPNISLDNLIELFAEEIKMPLQSRLKETKLSEKMKTKTKRYININQL